MHRNVKETNVFFFISIFLFHFQKNKKESIEIGKSLMRIESRKISNISNE